MFLRVICGCVVRAQLLSVGWSVSTCVARKRCTAERANNRLSCHTTGMPVIIDGLRSTAGLLPLCQPRSATRGALSRPTSSRLRTLMRYTADSSGSAPATIQHSAADRALVAMHSLSESSAVTSSTAVGALSARNTLTPRAPSPTQVPVHVNKAASATPSHAPHHRDPCAAASQTSTHPNVSTQSTSEAPCPNAGRPVVQSRGGP